MRKLLIPLVLLLFGCGDSGTATQEAGFADFVADQLATTADDTDAASINDLAFEDAASEDEDLFAGLLD